MIDRLGFGGVFRAWLNMVGFLVGEQRHCFHHDPATRQTWVKSRLIDMGRSKMFWCTHCEWTWVV